MSWFSTLKGIFEDIKTKFEFGAKGKTSAPKWCEREGVSNIDLHHFSFVTMGY